MKRNLMYYWKERSFIFYWNIGMKGTWKAWITDYEIGFVCPLFSIYWTELHF